MIGARISNEREMSTPETYAWRCEGVSKPAALNDLSQRPRDCQRKERSHKECEIRPKRGWECKIP